MRHYCFLLLLAFCTLDAKPLPEWRGFCRLLDGELYSLTDTTADAARWARIGEKHFGFTLLSGTATVLVLLDEETGKQHELARAETRGARAPFLPALSKEEALSLLRAQFRAFDPTGLRQLSPTDLTEDDRKKLARIARETQADGAETAAILNLNARAATPEPPQEIVDFLNEQRGFITLSKEAKDGVPHTFGFKKLTLESLPPHVRAHLVQEDLDSLLDEQVAMMKKLIAALKKQPAPRN